APIADEVALGPAARDEVPEAIVDVVEERVAADAAAQAHVVGDAQIEIEPRADVGPGDARVDALVPGLVLGDRQEILRLLDHVGATRDADLDRGLQPVEERSLFAAVGAAQAEADRLVALLDQITATDPRRPRARALRVTGVAALE